MKYLLSCLVIACVSFAFYQCDGNVTSDDVNRAEEARKLYENEQVLKETGKLRESITDATFLEVEGGMSDQAVSPLTAQGENKDYLTNQVIYLAALERCKKHLSCSNNRLALDIKSGKEVNIAEDLFQFIRKVVEEWNKGTAAGILKIVQNKDSGYDVIPVR